MKFKSLSQRVTFFLLYGQTFLFFFFSTAKMNFIKYFDEAQKTSVFFISRCSLSLSEIPSRSRDHIRFSLQYFLFLLKISGKSLSRTSSKTRGTAIFLGGKNERQERNWRESFLGHALKSGKTPLSI